MLEPCKDSLKLKAMKRLVTLITKGRSKTVSVVRFVMPTNPRRILFILTAESLSHCSMTSMSVKTFAKKENGNRTKKVRKSDSNSADNEDQDLNMYLKIQHGC